MQHSVISHSNAKVVGTLENITVNQRSHLMFCLISWTANALASLPDTMRVI